MGDQEEAMRIAAALIITGVVVSISGLPSPSPRTLDDSVHVPDFYEELFLLGEDQIPQKRGFDAMRGLTFGKEKRNFDEIDRAGFGRFVKRNFDEIDRAGFGRFVKRNFDEIDKAGFGGMERFY